MAPHRGAVAPAVTIRRATSEHVGAVAAIEAASFTQPWSRRSFFALVRASNVLFLVATDEGERVLGYAVVYVAADESELANLAVPAETRGTGVGRKLLQAAISAALERGARTMFLEVRESNAVAQALYRSAGFQDVARRKRYYEEPVEDALVMRRDFSEPAAGGMAP